MPVKLQVIPWNKADLG